MKRLTTDVIVVGGGAAGLLAAIRCREAGREVVLVEASPFVGGSTAADTGTLWLPAASPERAARPDGVEDALEYLDAVLGPPTAASSAARRRTFVETAKEVAGALATAGVQLTPLRSQVDLHPDAPKARRGVRTMASQPFDRRELGPVADLLRASAFDLELAPRSPRGALAAARSLLQRAANPTKDLVSGGAALAGRLLGRAGRLGVTLWTSSEFVDLLGGPDGVGGARVLRQGAEVELRANEGVILACGGFEGNASLRREHLPLPTDAAWSTGLPSNAGAGILAASRLGAPLAAMDDAWWTIVAVFAGKTYRVTKERGRPHGIIVDRAGDRFFDEAAPAPEAGRALYERNRRVRAIPSFLILDNRHRQRYRLGPWLPGSLPPGETDDVVRAQSLADLAGDLRIDQAGLLGTAVRFNGFAAKGKDADFGRGDSAADRVHGDPGRRKNPCLGTLERSPYWAVPVYPGDTGTKGGVLVDADARVLGTGGVPIGGLYAAGGTAASLFPRTSPGDGAALASALVDALRAAEHLTGTRVGGADASG